MKFSIITFAALLAAGPTAFQSVAAQDIEPGLSADDIGFAEPLSATWMARGPGDFRAAKLVADPAGVPASEHAESLPVQFSWPLAETPAATFDLPRVDSRQYWFDATGGELAKGISLPLTAPGAVIRISPLDASAKVRIAPDRLTLSIDDRSLDAGALDHLADGAALKAAGMDVPEASLAFQLAESVPAGSLKLGVGALPTDERMVVHVFEPRSPWAGQLTLPARDFFTGDAISMGFGIGDGKSQLPVASVQAVVTDPTARRQFDVRLDPSSGTLVGELPKDLDVTGRNGLFEAHAYIETTTPDGLVVRRDLKIPFSVAPPLARLDGTVKAELGDGLALDVGVETAVAGRYQLNGQVYGTRRDGTLAPIAQAQVAGVLPTGSGSLQLKVDRTTLAASGLDAPFEVRGLELLDQGRMFRLERQQDALRITR